MMEHIGKYKGYDVYKTPKSGMKYNEDKVLYAVSETGELVLKGEVVGKVNFSTGSVTEFDDHKCYRYKYPTVKREAADYVDTPARGSKVYNDYKGTTVANADLDKMIDDFIKASRTVTIEEMVGVFIATQ